MTIKKYLNFKKSEKWVKNIKEYKRLLLPENIPQRRIVQQVDEYIKCEVNLHVLISKEDLPPW